MAYAREKDKKLKFQAQLQGGIEPPPSAQPIARAIAGTSAANQESSQQELLQQITNQLESLLINLVQGVRAPQPGNDRNHQEGQRQAREYVCYNCGEVGHGMYFCPHPRCYQGNGNHRRAPRQQVTPPQARPPNGQQNAPMAPPIHILRPPPPPPQAPVEIPPLPSGGEDRAVSVISSELSAGTQGSATQDPHIAASDSSSDFDVMEGYPMQQHPESSSQDMHTLGQQPGVSMFSRLKETLSRATRSEHATNEINEGGGEVDSPFTSQIDPVLSESIHVSAPATAPIGLSELTPSETLLHDGRSLAEVQEVERYILAAREKEIESLLNVEQCRATLAKAPMTSANPLQSPELTTLLEICLQFCSLVSSQIPGTVYNSSFRDSSGFIVTRDSSVNCSLVTGSVPVTRDSSVPITRDSSVQDSVNCLVLQLETALDKFLQSKLVLWLLRQLSSDFCILGNGSVTRGNCENWLVSDLVSVSSQAQAQVFVDRGTVWN
ncbi:hypothetical protein L7F22_063079 [Adiantum nelumboides]|nr:hypothetical protein [Adiantum nelumboides]